jgi:hypothetical protein
MMMLLQSDAIQIGAGALLSVNTLLLLRLVFGAGRVMEQIDTHEKRIVKLEARCPFEKCPLKPEVVGIESKD